MLEKEPIFFQGRYLGDAHEAIGILEQLKGRILQDILAEERSVDDEEDYLEAEAEEE